MKIKMLATSAGPEGCFLPGAVREVSEDAARDLVDGGYAELLAGEAWVPPPPPEASAPAPAVDSPPAPPRKRGKG